MAGAPLFARALLPGETFKDEKLMDFLQSVQGLFCDDGVSQKVREQFDRADSDLRETKSSALQAQILTEEARKIASEQHSGQGFATLEQLWSMSEAVRFVTSQRRRGDKENLSPVGGITVDDIKAASGMDDSLSPAKHQGMRSAVLPIVEQRLRVRCEALASFCEPRAGLSFGKTSILPDLLKKRVAEVQQRDERVQRQNMEHVELMCEQLQMQTSSIEILTWLIEEFKLKWQAEEDEGKKAELIAYTQAQVIKVAKIRDEVRVDTYTDQTTPALRKIRDILQEEQRKLEKEQAETVARLRAYEEAGPLLEEIVAEQQKILHEIREKEWALQQVREG